MVAEGWRKRQDDQDWEGQGLWPADPLGQRFLEYFHHPWGFIHAPTPPPGARPDWRTETRYPLQPRNLWKQYQNPDELLGLRFGSETNYLLLDADADSQYHPLRHPDRFNVVLAVLENIGLCRYVAIQSSPSGGLHIYYFFAQKLNSFYLSLTVCLALRQAGISLKGGQLEIFPNPKPYGKGKPTNFNAHRLPLQAGSCLLDHDFQAYSNNLAEFLDAAAWSAAGQDYDVLHQAIADAKGQGSVFRKPSGNSVKDFKRHLEERIEQGWTGFHQTNELLKDIACYGIVFLGLQGQPLVDYVVATAEAAPGYRQYCRHQHEIERRAADRARNCEAFYSPYPSFPNRLYSYKEQFGDRQNAASNIIAFPHPNQQRHEKTLTRVAAVVALLKDQGEFPATASARAKAIITASKALYGIGVSQTTLHKSEYLPLWHPLREPSTTEERVNVASVQVVGATQPEKYPPLPDPWRSADEPKSLAPQAVQGEGETIYTLPPYMKVVCLPAAAEIKNKNFNSIQITTDKLNQYPLSGGTTLDGDKPALSIAETPEPTVVATHENAAESSVDSNTDISLPATPPDSSSDSPLVSTPVSTRVSIPAGDSPTKTSPREGDIFSALLSPLVVSPSPAATMMPLGETEAADGFSPEQHRQALALRLRTLAKAKDRVKWHCLAHGIRLIPGQRQELEQLALRILLAQSDSPILWREAHEWFVVNRDHLKHKGLDWISLRLFPDLSG